MEPAPGRGGASPVADAGAGVAVLAVAAVAYAAAGEIEVLYPDDPGVGPRFLPRTVSVLIGLLGLALAVPALARLRRGRRARDDAAGGLRPFLVWVLPLGLLSFAYVGLVHLFQYLLPTAVVTAVVLAVFGNRGWPYLTVVPALAALAFYYVFFVLLRLYEPPGALLDFG